MVTSHWKGVKRQGKQVSVVGANKIVLIVNEDHISRIKIAKRRIASGETVDGRPGFDPKPSVRTFKRSGRRYTVSWGRPALFQRMIAAA